MTQYSLSIVSHGQAALVKKLVQDFKQQNCQDIEVILTLNLPEVWEEQDFELPFPLKTITNEQPKGFAANHNQAFQQATGAYFAILNPDLRLLDNPFPALAQTLLEDEKLAVVAPQVVNNQGKVEDNARQFLTLRRLGQRLFRKSRPLAYSSTAPIIYPEWAGGMFLLFSRAHYQKLGGLSEAYYLYCEDMDLGLRVQRAGLKVAVNNQVKVIHEAQRASHRKLKYMYWHLTSLLIFFKRWYFA